jgi:hypothetical protein
VIRTLYEAHRSWQKEVTMNKINNDWKVSSVEEHQ